MVDLRTPYERRSDQLSVLIRRPLTVTSLVPRFIRTGQNVAAQFGFEDFDSDADTDATSGRLRRSSSASVLSLPSEARLTPPSTVPPPPPAGGRRPLAVIVDAPLGMGNFERSRAKSFYGKAQDVAGDAPAPGATAQRVGEGPSAIDEHTLREELGEDYKLFAPRRREAETETVGPTAAKPPKPPSPKCNEANNFHDDANGQHSDELEGHNEDSYSMSLIRERSATAPSLRRWNTMGTPTNRTGLVGKNDTSGSGGDGDGDDCSSTSSDTRRGGNIVRRLVSATTPRVGLGLKPRRSERRSRSEAHEVMFDRELTARADELRKLIVDTRAASTPPVGTPLFVEEAGRAPRVAFVDGDIKRVRVQRKASPAGRPSARGGLRSSVRFNIRRRRLSRRSSRMRKPKGKKGFAFGLVQRMQKADRKLRKRKNKNEPSDFDDVDLHQDGYESSYEECVRSGRGGTMFRRRKR